MKTLAQLIADLCPNGVPYFKIGDFAIQLNGMTGVSNKWKEDGNCRFIDYMNVYKNISVDITNLPFATVKSLTKQSVLQKGDILFTSASETPFECALSSNIEGEIPEGILLDDHYLQSVLSPNGKIEFRLLLLNIFSELIRFA